MSKPFFQAKAASIAYQIQKIQRKNQPINSLVHAWAKAMKQSLSQRN